MRPRVFPAEDAHREGYELHGSSGASMRPRVFPAEDARLAALSPMARHASMRPRVFPAEDMTDLIGSRAQAAELQ